MDGRKIITKENKKVIKGEGKKKWWRENENGKKNRKARVQVTAIEEKRKEGKLNQILYEWKKKGKKSTIKIEKGVNGKGKRGSK